MPNIPEPLCQALWIATENIARFQERLKTAENHRERQMLECTLVLEHEKLASLAAEAKALGTAKHSPPKIRGATA